VRILPGVLFYDIRAFRLVYLASSRDVERRLLNRDEARRIAVGIASALFSSRPSTRNTPGPSLLESRRAVVKEHHRLAAF
jgi:hypothetical protein